jgi:hypothetical protein
VGLLTLGAAGGCGVPRDDAPLEKIIDDPLQLVELMSKNEGAWVDGRGETDDWIEIANLGQEAISLSGYTLADSNAEAHPLPGIDLEAGERMLLWPDDDPEQGPEHLPFKLSSGGETLTLRNPVGALIQVLELPALEPNQAWTRFDGGGEYSACMWATPASGNGDACGPPPPPSLDDDFEFADFEWPSPWPDAPAVALNELSIDFESSSGFVELTNNTASAVDLGELRLELASAHPSLPWPNLAEGIGTGVQLPLAGQSLEAGAMTTVSLAPADLQALADSPYNEGVLTLFGTNDLPLDRLDFLHWPAGASLARLPDGHGYAVFCETPTPEASNEACSPLASRPIESYARHLRTPGDFATLAGGGDEIGVESVKLVQDLELGDQVYYLDASTWDLHFTFTRRVIDQLEALDPCVPEDAAQFYQEWAAFSDVNYGDGERRYLLTTASVHGGSGLQTLGYFTTDQVDSEQMRTGFFAAMRHLLAPDEWSLHVKPAHIERALEIEGELPMVGPNAPFADLEYQPLNQVVGYGVLEFVPAHEILDAPLGPQSIVVTDLVPNDIPFVGGLITESFQTPLSHVNVLSKNRGSPNMALADARDHTEIAELFGQLVRLEVEATGFNIEVADPQQAAEFWEAQAETGPPQVPEIDTDARGVIPLSDVGLAALPSLGAKAAQLAELATLEFAAPDDVAACRYRESPGALSEATGVSVDTPRSPFAIPVVHSLEHFQASGAADRLAELREDEEFLANPSVRAQGLEEVRALIMAHPVDETLLADVEDAIEERFADARVRFRSSSNTEDLAGFSGAGLYTSLSGALGDPDRRIDDAMRTVWASLWNARAWDEREFFNVSQDDVAMAILCHEAFLSERANGVAVSRDITDPSDDLSDYINVQFGEATVTNPAPGISADQLVHHWWGDVYITRSSFAEVFDDAPVLTPKEIRAVDCALDEIQSHYRPLLDPSGENDWFAMEIEFKLIGEQRRLMIKQARPYSFGRGDVPNDCPDQGP